MPCAQQSLPLCRDKSFENAERCHLACISAGTVTASHVCEDRQSIQISQPMTASGRSCGRCARHLVRPPSRLLSWLSEPAAITDFGSHCQTRPYCREQLTNDCTSLQLITRLSVITAFPGCIVSSSHVLSPSTWPAKTVIRKRCM